MRLKAHEWFLIIFLITHTLASDTSIHSVIILPGAKVRYFCKDGLSPLTVMHVGQILNFGGDLVPVNCGAGNEIVALKQALDDMDAAFSSPDISNDERTKHDLYLAFQ